MCSSLKNIFFLLSAFSLREGRVAFVARRRAKDPELKMDTCAPVSTNSLQSLPHIFPSKYSPESTFKKVLFTLNLDSPGVGIWPFMTTRWRFPIHTDNHSLLHPRSQQTRACICCSLGSGIACRKARPLRSPWQTPTRFPQIRFSLMN